MVSSPIDYAVGVDVGGTNARAGVVSSRGKMLYSLKDSIPLKRGKQTLLQHVNQLIEECLEWSRQKDFTIKGIGFSCPGVLSQSKGIVYISPNIPEWKNNRVRQKLEKRFRLPVVLENDANAAALGEAWAGAGRNASSVVCLTLGTGVGGGVVLNGKIWHGADESAGEIGHMVVRDNGKKCRCGNWGCLEVYVSATGIVRETKELLKQNSSRSELRKKKSFTAEDVYNAAKKKDPLALKVTEVTAEILGAGLASLVHILNPQIIILGGGVAQAGAPLFTPLKKAVKKRCFDQPVRRLKIVPAGLGDHAGIIGAAKSFFSSKLNR